MKNKKTELAPKKQRKPRKTKAKDNVSSKSPISQTFKQLSASYGNQSFTPQDISQISNVDNFVPKQTINIESNPLFKYHKQYLNLKYKIIRTLAFCFYNVEQYAMLNYICHVLETKFKNQIGHTMATTDKYRDHQHRVQLDMQQILTVKKDQLMIRFLEGEKILKALADSRMIMDKENDNGMVKINNKFFNMLSSICDDLVKKVTQTQKQLNQIQKVTCKGCGAKRPYFQIQARLKCSCGSFQILKKNTHQQNHVLQSIRLLKSQISRVLQWRADMEQLRKKEIQRITLERKKNQENLRVTDADLDVSKAIEYVQKQRLTGVTFVSPWQKYPIQNTGVYIRMFQKQFAPKRSYDRAKQLQQMSATRKRRKLQKNQVIF